MNTKKIITIIALVIIIGLSLYWMVRVYSQDEEPAGVISMLESVGKANFGSLDIATAEDPFIALLQGVDDIDLNNLKLLSNPIFKDGLKDLSRPIQNLGRGRENPFATIGVGNLNLSEEKTQDEMSSDSVQFVFDLDENETPTANTASTTKATSTLIDKKTQAD